MNWQKQIYGDKSRSIDISDSDYQALLTMFCRKYDYKCQACGKRVRRHRLGLHHIVPQSRGGDNDVTNLILLCRICHDKIEVDIKRYPTAESIECCFSNTLKRPIEPPIITGIRWQQWVYGGRRNPMKDGTRVGS